MNYSNVRNKENKSPGASVIGALTLSCHQKEDPFHEKGELV